MSLARSADTNGQYRRPRENAVVADGGGSEVEALCSEWSEVIRAIITRRLEENGNGKT